MTTALEAQLNALLDRLDLLAAQEPPVGSAGDRAYHDLRDTILGFCDRYPETAHLARAAGLPAGDDT